MREIEYATRYSRYRESTRVLDDDGEWLTTPEPLATHPRPDDRFHIIEEEDRLDVLAHRYLGDMRFWWVIAEFNDIAFGFDLPVGKKLRIPSLRRLEMEVFGDPR